MTPSEARILVRVRQSVRRNVLQLPVAEQVAGVQVRMGSQHPFKTWRQEAHDECKDDNRYLWRQQHGIHSSQYHKKSLVICHLTAAHHGTKSDRTHQCTQAVQPKAEVQPQTMPDTGQKECSQKISNSVDVNRSGKFWPVRLILYCVHRRISARFKSLPWLSKVCLRALLAESLSILQLR